MGPVSVVRVPLWEWHGSGTVEACLVRGAKQPVRPVLGWLAGCCRELDSTWLHVALMATGPHSLTHSALCRRVCVSSVPQAVTGGPRLCAAHDLKLAMQLVGSHIDILDSMTAARSKQGGLVYDPRKPGDFMPHVHIFPPSNPIPGFCLLPMVVALASLITGRQVSQPASQPTP